MTRGAAAPAPGRRRIALGLAAGLFAAIIWAAWVVFTRHAVSAAHLDALTPLDVATLRFLGPALLLAPLWWRGRLRESVAPRGAPPWALVGIFCWGAPFALLAAAGAARVDAATFAALTPGMMPFWAAALGLAAFGRRPGPRALIGLALILAAAAIVLAQGAQGSGDLAGAPYLVGASILWAIFALAFPHTRLSPTRATGLVGVYSVAACLALLPVLESRMLEAPLAYLAFQFVAQGVFSGVLAVVAYTVAIDQLGPTRAAAFSAMVPGLAALMGWAALGEPPSALDWTALALASVGVALVNLWSGDPQPRTP